MLNQFEYDYISGEDFQSVKNGKEIVKIERRIEVDEFGEKNVVIIQRDGKPYKLYYEIPNVNRTNKRFEMILGSIDGTIERVAS